MKARMKLVPRTSSSVKLKTIFVYTAASVAAFGLILTITIVYLNLGNAEDVLAAGGNFTSKQSGNWVTNSTWTGGTPSVSDLDGTVTIAPGHDIALAGILSAKNDAVINVNGKLTISGDLSAKNGLKIVVNGELLVSGDIEMDNNGQLTVNSSGKVTTTGNISFKNNAQLAVDGKLNIGNNLQFDNNAVFSGNGQVSITGQGCNNWEGPGTCNDFVTLPIELLSFTAESTDEGVLLTWETATELNNDFFTIERSENGTEYAEIATVKGSGTTKEMMSYDFVDTKPMEGRSYYRLKQTDFDGKFEIFNPVLVDVADVFSDEPVISVFPNPIVGNTLNVTFTDPQKGVLELLDGGGNRIVSKMTDGFEGKTQLIISENLQPGLYYLKYRTNSISETVKLIKQR